MSDSFCVIPWIQLSTKSNGSFRLCCIASQEPGEGVLRNDQGAALNTLNSSPKEAWNSELAKRVRKEMLDGKKPELCKTCWKKESLGGSSKRIASNKIFSSSMNLKLATDTTSEDGSINFAPQYLDLRMGNFCNLKCAMCDPASSNQWYDDHVTIHKNLSFNDGGQNVILKRGKSGKYMPQDSTYDWYEKSDSFWNELNDYYPHIRQIYFVGGEPLIIKKHYEVLSMLVRKGFAGKIRLEYDTNLSVLPDKVVQLWKHFEHVWIRLSVEGVGELNNYIRYPSRWETIKSNFGRLQEMNSNFKLDLTVTWQIYNLLGVDDIWHQFDGLGHARILRWPPYFEVRNLPKEIKVMAINRLSDSKYRNKSEHLINYLSSHLEECSVDAIVEFIRVTRALDSMRTNKFSSLYPLLWKKILAFTEPKLYVQVP